MSHPIYRILSFEILGPYTLRVDFDNETSQCINFRSILKGELFAPLSDRPHYMIGQIIKSNLN